MSRRYCARAGRVGSGGVGSGGLDEKRTYARIAHKVMAVTTTVAAKVSTAARDDDRDRSGGTCGRGCAAVGRRRPNIPLVATTAPHILIWIEG